MQISHTYFICQAIQFSFSIYSQNRNLKFLRHFWRKYHRVKLEKINFNLLLVGECIPKSETKVSGSHSTVEKWNEGKLEQWFSSFFCLIFTKKWRKSLFDLPRYLQPIFLADSKYPKIIFFLPIPPLHSTVLYTYWHQKQIHF